MPSEAEHLLELYRLPATDLDLFSAGNLEEQAAVEIWFHTFNHAQIDNMFPVRPEEHLLIQALLQGIE
jgi:hypothetical protein